MKALRFLLALTLCWLALAPGSRADMLNNRVGEKSEYQPVSMVCYLPQLVEPQQLNWDGYGESASGAQIWTKFDPEGLQTNDDGTSPTAGQFYSRLFFDPAAQKDPTVVVTDIKKTKATPDVVTGGTRALGVAATAIVMAQPTPGGAAAPEEAALGSGISAGSKSPGLLTRMANAVADFFGVGEDATAPAVAANNDAKVATANVAPTSTAKGALIQQNAAQGQAFQQVAAGQAAQTQTGVVQELTLQTQSGVKTRIDIAGRDSTTGAVQLTEAKSSQTAPLTKNQAAAFPEIQQTGATVVGKGKPGFPGGTQIPPTTVNVVRPAPAASTSP